MTRQLWVAESFSRGHHKLRTLRILTCSKSKSVYIEYKICLAVSEALVNYQLTVHFDPRCAEAQDVRNARPMLMPSEAGVV